MNNKQYLESQIAKWQETIARAKIVLSLDPKYSAVIKSRLKKIAEAEKMLAEHVL